MDYYILNESGEPIPCSDITEWAKWLATADRTIAKTVIDGRLVSTVFLGLDHSFSGGPPILFETMVFDNGDDDMMRRYATRAEAIGGHAETVEQLKAQHD